MKDHYKTLESGTQASLQEIKTAYRRLARLYHPDKNKDTEKAKEYFQEIQEAYAVLSDPARRRTYDNELRHAGQYHWQQKSGNSSEKILKQATDLARYVNTLDGRSMNHEALADYILSLLSADNISLLQRADNTDTNTQISRHILHVSAPIVSSRLFGEIAARLLQINGDNETIKEELRTGLHTRRQQDRRNNLIPYAAIGIVLLVAILMWLILFL